MSWSLVRCQYEGGGYGEVVEVFVETDDVDEARRLIRDNRWKIEDFVEHSVQEEYMYPVSHPSFDYDVGGRDDVREVLRDSFNPDYAVCADGAVLWMKYHGEVVEVG